MVAARTTAKGLSTLELEQIRDTLSTGRKPKVMFTESAGQIAGQIGQVTALTDPELSEEWVVVRFGKDELPFSPTDLVIAPKAPAKRATIVPTPREEITVPAAPALSTVDVPAAPAGSPAADAAPPAPAPPADASPASTSVPGSTPTSGSTSGSASADPSGGAAKAAKAAPAKKAAKPKPPAGLTVTLSYAEGEWTVAATQGAKSLARPYVIKANEALKMVGMLDVPGVHEAVEEIVSAARAEAEQQAERLRAELAEIEARLAELRDTE